MKFFMLSLLLILTVANLPAQMGPLSADSLYVKIVKQRKMLPALRDTAFYRHMEQFDRLEDLRVNCKTYLNRYRNSFRNAKYRRVMEIQQGLKDYPVARVQFDEMKHLNNTIHRM